jgi:UDP-glucose 4-epimerase
MASGLLCLPANPGVENWRRGIIDPVSTKNILLTGAGGYVGSALALRLTAGGHRVTGFGHGTNYAALRARAPRGLELVVGDLTSAPALARALAGVDLVVHSAAVTGEAACRRDLPAAVRTIVRGTRLLVDAMAAVGTPGLIHVSTYGVYATFRPRAMPLAEEMELAPDDLYGALKAEAEWEVARVASVALRLTNVYGRGAGIILKRDVMGHFVRAVQEARPLRIFGDGSQGIDFVHVDDVCRVVAGLVDLPPARWPRVLNVGSGGVTPIRDLARLFASEASAMLGRDVPIVHEEAPREKLWPDRWVSIARVRALFPDFPAVGLAQGVRELLETSWQAAA